MIIEKERRLLAELSAVLERWDAGEATTEEVEKARHELRTFYRLIGLHP